MMESYDQSKGTLTLNDAIHRRIKNRERQRRYRARKRLKAVASIASVSNHSSESHIAPPFSPPNDGISEQVKTRVHCTRDWKKEARRLHSKMQEPLSNQLNCGVLRYGVEDESQTVGYGAVDDEQVRTKPRRRDWKAEARKNGLRCS